ncbi:hypothetical protein [Idiomarina sp. HP20-50]|uniref:hypothetical protein n=1 Tax=Idiomarina sp. HP20-50 TaxID=3070813 RepID=UPI00294B1BEF|nr:hypothetical protein [Idiomarina sp. HP20-50]MDV6315904.1 hypothetical protein [Idiomarina sp. HP20-50]
MRWKLLTFTCLLAAMISSSAIQTSHAKVFDNTKTENSNSKLQNTYRSIIDNHLHKNFSIMRTVRILINNYPEHATYIVNAAFDARGEARVTAIVVAAIQAEPAVTYNVVDVALSRYPNLADTIVKAAIQTEPAYIDDIITIALQHQPKRADSIIRQAVASHPDFSESVVRTAANEAPNFILSSIIKSIKALPDTAKSLIAVLKNFFTSPETGSDAYNITKADWQLLTLEAKQSGVSRSELKWLVEEGYLDQKTFAKIFRNESTQ